MRKGLGILFFVMFVMASVVTAFSQDQTCGNVVGYTSGRCPVPHCGATFTSLRIDGNCKADEECESFTATTFCCGALTHYEQDGWDCFGTEMQNASVQKHLLELAKTNEVLVPTCHGAYVPARIAFRQRKHEKNNVDGL